MPPPEPPTIVLLAGPNGAGKSTAAPLLVRETLGIEHYVNADEIARGLSGFAEAAAAVAAGRIELHRIEELARLGEDFAVETTLSGHTLGNRVVRLQQVGYRFGLLFLYLSSPEQAVARVMSRVAKGGHDIPPKVIHRRYVRGLENFFRTYAPLADTWALYDNSGMAPELIARGSRACTARIVRPDLWHSLRTRFGRSDG